jgi:putative ATPase
MPEPRWYQPVARGVEAKIGDKLAFLRQLDAEADSAADPGAAGS